MNGLHHSRLARFTPRSLGRARRRFLPYLMSTVYMGFGIGVLVVAMPWWLREHAPAVVPFDAAPWHWPALAVFVLGAAMYFGCAWDFARRGRGTPAFWDPPRRLILNPWFRVVRNPMYIGVGLMILAQGMWAGSTLMCVYAFAVVFGFHWFVVGYEEPHLRRTFGSKYRNYCRQVPRWIPRLARRTDQLHAGHTSE